MTLAAFLKQVVEILDEAAIQYMLTDSLAAAYYAVPRATQDIDLVLETEAEGVDRLVRGLLHLPTRPPHSRGVVDKLR